MSFDANGDPVARYELVNWQKSESGSIEMVTVGHYDASLPEGQEFSINRMLTWVEGSTEVRGPKATIYHIYFKSWCTNMVKMKIYKCISKRCGTQCKSCGTKTRVVILSKNSFTN